MTRSDELMLSAIRMRTDLSVNGREVKAGGKDVAVWLYGFPSVLVRFSHDDIRIDGNTRTSRKSAKVLNAILKAYTDCSISALGGCWILERSDGHRIPLGTRTATIPITRPEGLVCELETMIR